MKTVLYLGDVSLALGIEGEVDLCIICVKTESDVVSLDIFFPCRNMYQLKRSRPKSESHM